MNKLVKELLDFLRLRRNLLKLPYKKAIKEIVLSQFSDKKYTQDKTLVMMVGLSKTGKTYFIDNNPLLSEYFRISVNRILPIIHINIPFANNGNSPNEQGNHDKRYLTRLIMDMMLIKSLSMGIPIVCDSCNLIKQDRKRVLDHARYFGYLTRIIFIRCPIPILFDRLVKADEDNMIRGEKSSWARQYYDQIKRFDEPSYKECDDLVHVESPKDTPENIY